MYSKNHKWLSLLAGVLVVGATSCEKEEVPIDLELPSVVLSVSGNPEKLFNETTLSATATDNDAIKQVTFFLNSDSLGTDTEAPFELLWNTKEAEDNKYQLKAVAYDASGNKAEATKGVAINNTLFKVHIEAGYLEAYKGPGEDADFWIFLSDKEGNIVGEPQQFTSGTTLIWDRPAAYHSDTVYVNRLNYSYYSWEGFDQEFRHYSMVTLPNTALGELTYSPVTQSNSQQATVGSAGIYITQDPEQTKQYTYWTLSPGGGGIGRSSGESSFLYHIGLSQEKEYCFSTYGYSEENNPKVREGYYRWDELAIDQYYDFHPTEYKAMDEQLLTLPDGFDNIYVNTQSFLDEAYSNGYSMDRVNMNSNPNSSKTIKLFYADEIFPYYTTAIGGSLGNKSFRHFTYGKAPEVFTIPQFSLNIENLNMSRITTAPEGQFDLATVEWGYENRTETSVKSVGRAVYVSNVAGTYSIPEIPSVLLKKYPEFSNKDLFEYKFNYFLDYKGIDSYQEWFTSTMDPNHKSEGSTSLYIYPENEGGRILSEQFPSAIKEKLRERKEELQARGTHLH